MSRIANAPVELPQGVTATIAPQAVTIKGAKGSLSLALARAIHFVAASSSRPRASAVNAIPCSARQAPTSAPLLIESLNDSR